MTGPIPRPGYRPIGGPDDPRHGTIGGYTNYRCRCARCKEANRTHPPAIATRERYRRRQGMPPILVHLAVVAAERQPCGTHASYVRHRKNGEEARDECKAAEAAYKRTRRELAGSPS